MGTIAQKLEYLNDTRLLLKDNINKINNVLDDNSTFRSYPEELFNGYLDILNNGTDTLWNNLEKVSQTGTEAVLEGVETAPMKMVLNGNTSQDGEPTPDTPVEVKVVKGENVVSVSGKNLIKTLNFDETLSSVHVKTNEDGSITLNGTASSNYAINIITNWSLSLKNGKTYTLSGCPNYNDKNYLSLELYSNSPSSQYITDIGQGKSFALTSDRKYRLYIAIKAGKTYDNVTIYPMLEEGSTASEYTPFSKTDYPINLNANMFDPTQIPEGNFEKRLSTTGGLYGDIDYFVSDWIPIQPNTEYEVNWTPEAKKRICFYSSFLVNSFISSNDTENIFKTPNNATYMRFSNLTSEISNLSVKLKNSLELCKINTYKDYFHKDSGKWYVHKEVGKYIFSSADNIRVSGSNYYTNISPKSLHAQAYMNTYLYDNRTSGFNNMDNYYFGFENNGIFHIKNTDVANKDEMKQSLIDTNSYLVYVLATPTEEEITNTTLIEQLEAIYKAKSVKDKTYITQTNDDLPFILDVEAIKEYEVV